MTIEPRADTGVGMSSKDGVGYAVVNGKLAKTSQSEVRTDDFEFSYSWHNLASGEAGRRTLRDDELAMIATRAERISLVASTETTTRVRLGKTSTIFSQTLGGTVTVYADVAAGGIVTFKAESTGADAASVYYSIAGQSSVAGDVYDNNGDEPVGIEGITAAGQDMTSAQLDAAYLGKTASPDAATGSEATWNTTHATDLLKVNIA